VPPLLRSILVPLDGSPFAERAVAYAAELATAAEASLLLVRTAESSRLPHPGQRNAYEQQAQVYLEELRRRLHGTGVAADVAVPPGHAPEALLAEVHRQKPDLIVLTSHGHSGFRHTLLGGVAEAVVAAGQAPVLLLRQSAVEEAPSFRSLVGRRVVVLLDGSALAEAALPVALELARVLASELILFKAVDVCNVPYAVPTELMTVPELDVQLAWDASFDVRATEAYLSLVMKRLNRQAPDTAIQTRIQVGDLVEQVRGFDAAANRAAEAGIGLVVMATHGRTGLTEALWRSRAQELLRATAYPLVVVHPPGERPDWWSTEYEALSGAST
jgi:nucleotide-binding universal stress UspA family protein